MATFEQGSRNPVSLLADNIDVRDVPNPVTLLPDGEDHKDIAVRLQFGEHRPVGAIVLLNLPLQKCVIFRMGKDAAEDATGESGSSLATRK